MCLNSKNLFATRVVLRNQALSLVQESVYQFFHLLRMILVDDDDDDDDDDDEIAYFSVR